MKVVILAGGFGTRLSEETEIKPKPAQEDLFMQAVKGIYSRGKIELLESLDSIQSADLYVIAIPDKDQNCSSGKSNEIFNQRIRESEKEFSLSGFKGFFNTDDDANIDWEDAFGLKNQ